MDFFAHQDAARKKTGLLVVYFAAAVVLIIVAVYAALTAIGVFGLGRDLESGRAMFWNPELFVWVAGGTLALITGGSLYKTFALSGGGSSVAEALGGRLLDPAPEDLHEQQLLNVVEEMSIASGCAVPPIYVLDREPGINAFAAGLTSSDAVIGVTRGAMTLLSRDQLQGVMAHEFGHILNGDTRLNLRLIGILHGILMIALVGRVLLGSRTYGRRSFGSRSSRSSDGRLALLGVALLAIGGIGVLFGRLIKSAVSRQREFLADASAVQFTRNPAGLAGALQRIGGLAIGSRVDSPRAEEVSHMFFGNALRSSFAGWMSTHPPLPVRIKRIDPSFDGEFAEVFPDQVSAVDLARSDTRVRAAVSGLVGKLDPSTVVGGMGQVSAATLSYADRLLAALPAPVTAAAHDPRGACAVVYGLLLHPDQTVRLRQLSALEGAAGPEIRGPFEQLLPHIDTLRDETRLPLLDLALPALRNLHPRQYKEFRRITHALVNADRQVDLFEYALERALDRYLEPRFSPKRRRSVRANPEEVLRQLGIVLSALAHQASSDPDHARSAFEKGLQTIAPPRPPLSLSAPQDCGTDALDTALRVLASTPPFVKKLALEACAASVLADSEVTIREFELLRAIADSLDCPIPPMVEQTTPL